MRNRWEPRKHSWARESVTDAKFCMPFLDWACRVRRSRKEPSRETVPQTDTGGLVENTKALERSTLKELGKLLS